MSVRKSEWTVRGCGAVCSAGGLHVHARRWCPLGAGLRGPTPADAVDAAAAEEPVETSIAATANDSYKFEPGSQGFPETAATAAKRRRTPSKKLMHFNHSTYP